MKNYYLFSIDRLSKWCVHVSNVREKTINCTWIIIIYFQQIILKHTSVSNAREKTINCTWIIITCVSNAPHLKIKNTISCFVLLLKVYWWSVAESAPSMPDSRREGREKADTRIQKAKEVEKWTQVWAAVLENQAQYSRMYHCHERESRWVHFIVSLHLCMYFIFPNRFQNSP